jgi:hypothetical protein
MDTPVGTETTISVRKPLLRSVYLEIRLHAFDERSHLDARVCKRLRYLPGPLRPMSGGPYSSRVTASLGELNDQAYCPLLRGGGHAPVLR